MTSIVSVMLMLRLHGAHQDLAKIHSMSHWESGLFDSLWTVAYRPRAVPPILSSQG